MQNEFLKYKDRGAYHWNEAYPGNFRRTSPKLNALYNVPLDIVQRKTSAKLDRMLGLDLGCGDGVLCYRGILRGADMVGLDLSESGLKYALREIADRTDCIPNLVNGSTNQLPFPDTIFDFVISVEVIEHIEDDRLFVSEAYRVLKPGGVFVCTTPHRLLFGPLVQDRYHMREYYPHELQHLLLEQFIKVEVLGLFPNFLDKLYTLKQPRFAGLLIRFLFKSIAKIYNPFRRILIRKIKADMQTKNIIGVGIKD